MKVLLTSTSFQDVAGEHQEILNKTKWDIDSLRGPLNREEMLAINTCYDALICGDDCLDENVLAKLYSQGLRYISKYGVGMDKIDMEKCESLGIKYANCRGVNENAVSEHVFALLLAYSKNIISQSISTRNYSWNRLQGLELFQKTIGIVGLGAIGHKVAVVSKALGMRVIAYDPYAKEMSRIDDVTLIDDLEVLFDLSDFVTLHVPSNEETRAMFQNNFLSSSDFSSVVLINTSRGDLFCELDILKALEIGKLKAYLTDVLKEEPITRNCKIVEHEKVIITPHIGSRTKETVARQGTMAVENLIKLTIS